MHCFAGQVLNRPDITMFFICEKYLVNAGVYRVTEVDTLQPIFGDGQVTQGDIALPAFQPF